MDNLPDKVLIRLFPEFSESGPQWNKVTQYMFHKKKFCLKTC